MAKDPTTSTSRTASVGKRVRERQQAIARERLTGLADWGKLIQSPRNAWGVLIAVGFAIACTLVVVWARERPLLVIGRVVDETRLVRVPMASEDKAATDQARSVARQATPRVFVADTAVLEDIAGSLENLPRTLASADALDGVDPKIRELYDLNASSLAAVRNEAIEGKPSEFWTQKVRAFVDALRKRPLVDEQTWQRTTQDAGFSDLKLIYAGNTEARVLRSEMLNADDKARRGEAMFILARDAGFSGPLRQLVVARATNDGRPTFRFDEQRTRADQDAMAAAVRPVILQVPAGSVIVRRGDVLSPEQFELYRSELRAYRQNAEPWSLWLQRVGVAGAAGVIALALGGYVALFCPRVRRSEGRMLGVALLLLGTLMLACVATAASPNLIAIAATAPSLMAGLILCIAYDRRSALAFGVLHAVLVCLALHQGVTLLATIVAGVGAIVWSLRDLRDRGTLVRTSLVSGLIIGAAHAILCLTERPLSEPVLREIYSDAGLAAAGAVIVGGITLFILPSVERLFDITTGMTLIELRDPKHPLLRELQLRAPGTYNHSLTVASIAESAAEAIGADGLLTYVGCLYHDIGKMNKPDYFVENQSPGVNKHDKLSPAMSLLLVVGHVKDGLELARDFNIPRPLHHFIESHHGTTLVEFFFHRARERALSAMRESGGGEGDLSEGGDPALISEERMEFNEPQVPDEFAFRYPGPKPQSREAAILMVCDAVESATRTLSDPTPARIDALVRSIANKRLMDGQFEDCEITLRDLHLIVESVSRSVASIYHARIAYPGPSTRTAEAARA
ncbi:MAG: HDIG domain-containing protein [Planctomycetota bacterium]|nr:HDIG domain-containing protein [Planctomycetota bacterium]